jgi:cyclophilin family peptidyl-prolyl cis-trans isomerase
MTFEQTAALQDGDKVVVMKTTNGTMTIKMFTKEAPKTALNFMGLAQKGYYNGIIFHRIIKSFMIQGGDPTGTGMGGESIYGEKFDDEFNSDLKNIPYSLSMANSGPNTNGSQFFINHVDNGFLNNKHAVFGQVVDGLDNVDKIIKVKTDGSDKPVKEVKMISVDVKEYKN